jgi:hypothetical protein
MRAIEIRSVADEVAIVSSNASDQRAMLLDRRPSNCSMPSIPSMP